MYATDVRQTSDRQTSDVRQKHRLMPPPVGRGIIRDTLKLCSGAPSTSNPCRRLWMQGWWCWWTSRTREAGRTLTCGGATGLSATSRCSRGCHHSLCSGCTSSIGSCLQVFHLLCDYLVQCRPVVVNRCRWKKHSERRKHCALAVVRWSQ